MSDPRADWEQVQTLDEPVRLTRVVHGDGVWVAIGRGSDFYTHSVSATSADGPWTAYGSVGTFEADDLYYADGYWVIGGAVATATDPTDAWTMHTSGPGFAANVAFGDGVWGAIDDYAIYSATVPSGSWTLETEITISGQELWSISRIAYLNGEWIIVINTSPDNLCRVLTASDLGGPWTQQASFSADGGDTILPANIEFTDEGYFILFRYTVWYAPTLDGTWTRINQGFDWVTYGDGQYVWTRGNDIYVSDAIDETPEDQDVNDDDSAIYASTYGDGTWVAVGEVGLDAAVWVAGEGGEGWGVLL